MWPPRRGMHHQARGLVHHDHVLVLVHHVQGDILGLYVDRIAHGYVVDMDKLDPKVAVPAFINVNDGTNEGLKYTGKNIFTVQYHPEACAGPQDSAYLFGQ